MEIIIYENVDKTLGIFISTTEARQLFDNKVLGEKSTPLGLPFWIVEQSVLPSDYSERTAWRLDGTEGTPDGYGKKVND